MLRRRPWLIVMMGICGIAAMLAAAGAAYWQYANFVPEYPRPAVVMPMPNAYDDYVRAGQMCRAAGGSNVTPGSVSSAPGMPGGPEAPGLPLARTAPPQQAFEEGVPLADVRAVVARNRPALARLRQGFGKQYRTPPATSPAQTFPELAQCRELARVLITEAKLAEREGRMADAARSYLDCLRLGTDLPRGGPLIHGLVGIAIEAIGLSAMSRSVDQMDATTAGATARAMFRLEQQAPGAADVMQAEKEYGAASMVQTFREGINWRQISQPGGFSSGNSAFQDALFAIRFSLTPKRQMLNNYCTYMDAAIADARKPYYVTSTMPPPPKDPLSEIMLPVFSPVRWRWTQRAVNWRLLELRLAARAYTARHGKPAPSASALVPAYLPAVPRDPCADKPLVYRVKDGHALIYSRGPDGDDDGGIDLGVKAEPGMNGDLASMGRRGR